MQLKMVIGRGDKKVKKYKKQGENENYLVVEKQGENENYLVVEKQGVIKNLKNNFFRNLYKL